MPFSWCGASGKKSNSLQYASVKSVATAAARCLVISVDTAASARVRTGRRPRLLDPRLNATVALGLVIIIALTGTAFLLTGLAFFFSFSSFEFFLSCQAFVYVKELCNNFFIVHQNSILHIYG